MLASGAGLERRARAEKNTRHTRQRTIGSRPNLGSLTCKDATCTSRRKNGERRQEAQGWWREQVKTVFSTLRGEKLEEKRAKLDEGRELLDLK